MTSDELELDVSGLSVSYGKVRALENVDLQVRKGEVVSLLGSNGAGKSTLLNALTCVVPKRSGHVKHQGRDVTRSKPWELVAAGLVHVPEGRQVFAHLTVEQHLRLAHVKVDAGRQEFSVEDAFELFPRLQERRHLAAGNLSGGEQQMVVVGRALVTQPSVLLLDEPSLGLSPKLAQTVISAVAGLRDRGISVLLVEQNAALALSVSDHVFVLANGEIVARGTAAEMKGSEEVRRAYLGGQPSSSTGENFRRGTP
jgi:branched-chain amino acid transport system ATP-binding protein